MRKGVNAALKTKYESKEWKKWFVETAKRLMEKLDAESEDDNVSECVSVRVNVCVRYVVIIF